MKIILAQGNPGTQYSTTRHNIGWILLDTFAQKHGASFKPEKKFFAEIATLTLQGEKVLLVKPTTFYNETGRTARALVDFYKLTPAQDLLVLHDDLALPFGTLRVRNKGSDAGNNGIKSLNAHLGEQYWRVRAGIWEDHRNRVNDVDFVLGTFSATTREAITKTVAPQVDAYIISFIHKTLEASSVQLL